MTYTSTEKDIVTRMALSAGYEILSDAVYDALGVIQSANIRWADEISGSITNVVSDAFGISSIQFNRELTKQIIVTISRDDQGKILDSTVQTIGFTS